MSAGDTASEAGTAPPARPASDAGGPTGAAPARLVGTAGFRPTTGTMEDWNAAYVRVEDYLRAHRIHNRLHQSRLIEQVLERAARRHVSDPSASPTALAADEIDDLMQRWFAGMLGEAGHAPERIATEGRLALLLCNGAERWPYAFLDEETFPSDFVKAMRAGVIEAGPDMSVSSMVPRPIDLGPIPEAAGETIERIERWPMLQTVLLWLFFAACLAAIFKITR